MEGLSAEDDDAAEIDDDGFGTGATMLRDLVEAGMAMVRLLFCISIASVLSYSLL